MKYSKEKKIATFVHGLIHYGWQYRMGGLYEKQTAPTGRRIPVPCTPSDHRAFHNFMRDIRKLLTYLLAVCPTD